MKKLLLVVLAVFFMSGIATAATTVEIKGQIRVYPETNNIARSSGLLPDYLIAKREAHQNVFTDQRTRLYFNARSDENVGAAVAFEIDSFWGMSEFEVARNGTGAGQGTDAVNIEVKYANFWFKPTSALKITAGTMTYADDISGVLVGGGDMAGFRFDLALSNSSSLATGLYTWNQNNITGASGNKQWKDSIYFIPVTFKQQLGGGAATAFIYTIQDSTKAKDLPAGAPINGYRPMPNNYEKASIYYAGLNYGGKAGMISYYLMGAYNFGEIKDYETTATTKNDLDISAFAVNAKVDVKIGAGKLRVNGLWISGGDKTPAQGKFNGFVTGDQYAGHQTMPLLQDDLILLINNTDVMSNATFLLTTPNNNGDGVWVTYGAFDYDLTPKFNVKAAVGYAAADKNFSLNGAQTRKGKGMGTEFDAHMQYKFSDNLVIRGVAAYAKIGDYFNTATFDADSAYRVLLKFIYTF